MKSFFFCLIINKKCKAYSQDCRKLWLCNSSAENFYYLYLYYHFIEHSWHILGTVQYSNTGASNNKKKEYNMLSLGHNYPVRLACFGSDLCQMKNTNSSSVLYWLRAAGPWPLSIRESSLWSQYLHQIYTLWKSTLNWKAKSSSTRDQKDTSLQSGPLPLLIALKMTDWKGKYCDVKLKGSVCIGANSYIRWVGVISGC